MKHVHLSSRWSFEKDSDNFENFGTVFSKMETLDVIHPDTHVENFKLLAMQNNAISPIRAIRFSQYSRFERILDFSLLSARHNETCEYLDLSSNQFYAVAHDKCSVINFPKLKLLDLSYNLLFSEFSTIFYRIHPSPYTLYAIATLMDSFQELQILSLYNQTANDKYFFSRNSVQST